MTRLAFASFVVLLSLAASSFATDGHEAKVEVTLVVILAGEEDGPVDPRLKAVAAEVQRLNPQLKSFKLQTMVTRALEPRERTRISLVDDTHAEVQIKKGADAENRVELAVTAPDQGEIVYRTVSGKFLPIVTRYQTRNHERLILAIRVRPAAE